MYLGTPLGRVIALDPATGRERWVFDPKIKRDVSYGDFASRGVSTWLDESAPAVCRRRIFVATAQSQLFALDARDGRSCAGFGRNGMVDLKAGLRIPPFEPGAYSMTSPPVVVNGLVITGSSIADNSRPNPASGEVRAYDARTGAIKWTWDPIPQDPKDPAYGEWRGAMAEKGGAANAWSVLAADAGRDLVFIPTGSAAPDYYGVLRLGRNRYANSIAALRASTGKLVWAFQTVHHDLWDYDNASPPALVTVTHDGAMLPAVLQATKTGMLFVLERETGRPIFPVEERPVPASDIPAEQASPTQPFTAVIAPLSPHRLTPDDVWGATDAVRTARRHRPEDRPPLVGGAAGLVHATARARASREGPGGVGLAQSGRADRDGGRAPFHRRRTRPLVAWLRHRDRTGVVARPASRERQGHTHDLPARVGRAIRRDRGLRGRRVRCGRLRRRVPARGGASHPLSPSAVGAAVAATIFPAEPTRLGARAEDLGPLAVLEHAHIAAREDLERTPDLLRVVELGRAALAEPLEPRRIHEIAQRDAVDGELDLFHGIGGLIGVEHVAVARGRQIDRRIDEHLGELVARRHAHLLFRFEGGLDEHLRERQAVGREVVIAERVRHIRSVEERERPGALPESGRLEESRRCAPHRDEILIHELLERGDEPVEIHAQGRGGPVETGDGGHLAAVECGGDEARTCGLHEVSFAVS